MSGGDYNYEYRRVEEEYSERMHDAELNELIIDLVVVLRAVEWWKSCDSSEETYRNIVKEFKNKWFKSNREDRLKNIVVRECEKLKQELFKIL